MRKPLAFLGALLVSVSVASAQWVAAPRLSIQDLYYPRPAVQMSQDGQLVMGEGLGRVFWNNVCKAPITCDPTNAPNWNARFVSGGRYVLRIDGYLAFLYDPYRGKNLWVSGQMTPLSGDTVACVRESLDTKRFYFATAKGIVGYLSSDGKTVVSKQTSFVPSNSAPSVAIGRGGSIACYSTGRTINVYSTVNGQRIATLDLGQNPSGQDESAQDIQVSVDGTTIYTLQMSTEVIKRWHLGPTGYVGTSIYTAPSGTERIELDPTESRIAFRDSQTVCVISTSGTVLFQKSGLDSQSGRPSFDSTGGRILIGSTNPNVQIFDLKDGTLVPNGFFQSGMGTIWRGSGELAYAHNDNLYSFDAVTGVALRRETFADTITRPSFNPSGSRRALGVGNVVQLANGADGVLINQYTQAGTHDLYAIAMSPTSDEVAFTDFAKAALRVWNATTGVVREVALPTLSYKITYSNDGQSIIAVVGPNDNVVSVFDAGTLALRFQLPAKPRWISAIAVSPDSRTVAIVYEVLNARGYVNYVAVHDMTTGQKLADFTNDDPNSLRILCPSFCPDGTSLTWLESSGQQALRFATPLGASQRKLIVGAASDASWSPSGDMIALGSSIIGNPQSCYMTRIRPDSFGGYGGETVGAHLEFSAPMPATTNITLYLVSSGVQMPSSVSVPSGATSVDFDVHLNPTSTPMVARIRALYRGKYVEVPITVLPEQLDDMVLNVPSAEGGSTITGSVKLNVPAGKAGADITLTSSSSAATVPTKVHLNETQTDAVFEIQLNPVASPTPVTIRAYYRGRVFDRTVTVTPPTLKSFTLAETSGDGGTVLTGSIELSSPTAATGTDVVAYSTSGVATVTSPIHVAGGSATATLPITLNPVSVVSTSHVVVVFRGKGLEQVVTVNPPQLKEITLSAPSGEGGSTITATVSLTSPAPAKGADVVVYSTSGCATVVSPVHVVAGQSSAQFPVKLTPVQVAATSMINAVYAGKGARATVAVNPAHLTDMQLSRTSAHVGETVTLTLRISSPAPSAGTLVNLSTASTYAPLPASVKVSAGATVATVTITVGPTTSTRTVALKALAGGALLSTTLTISP